MSWLKEYYKNEVIPRLRERFGYKNIHQVPKLEKISVNMGLNEAVTNPKVIDQAMVELAQITGQKPKICRARKSIAGFKLRKGMPIGVMVTLRGDRMYDFLTRLINIALPRTKDFKGLPKSGFDGRGNYTFGITDHTIFPEIDTSKVEKIKGLSVTIVTTAKTDEEAYALLKELGMPFRG
ncbi:MULTISPECIES: 50S ribosomal protein L5 [Thermodesulfobacterium]|jgi:large subunit ribosomal protein L5|uniref:Large ribosomal subunit protein uL5 n=2 Tax=Thermodesulfobacterium commune TaxID=1741 RepID=A0A075WTM9_9BACT|nr:MULTISPECIES: 50S ribosomal protein L5 [Thermodesulfobacterium]KUJ98137.1 MAG: 50S ribosomal protein L5 [Thermodesulfobacterium sp. 37_54]KUK19783.1 MAG: 50S ribosomal protein L5 [Thermodesulfobacterium commune]AIH04226.1 50S ribosomal protein L5 [Thermodesulfobacterium commune DSM 2178]KUK37876.1 MAG: 50S ribosomal protein L5 [Thermodesulfobacterium commune]MBZ4682240.1 ribosomal protein [Thermodesulfobacterium sp.]